MNLPPNPRAPAEAPIRLGHLGALLHFGVEVPALAPIPDSVRCTPRGEGIMESRARLRNDQAVCRVCVSTNCYQLDGPGIGVA
ncbi:MAG: hypothetical protein M8467_03780 [Anaerolineae bacterium]|nr:hypothetical protein [Anaerolineae bacterium]